MPACLAGSCCLLRLPPTLRPTGFGTSCSLCSAAGERTGSLSGVCHSASPLSRFIGVGGRADVPPGSWMFVPLLNVPLAPGFACGGWVLSKSKRDYPALCTTTFCSCDGRVASAGASHSSLRSFCIHRTLLPTITLLCLLLPYPTGRDWQFGAGTGRLRVTRRCERWTGGIGTCCAPRCAPYLLCLAGGGTGGRTGQCTPSVRSLPHALRAGERNALFCHRLLCRSRVGACACIHGALCGAQERGERRRRGATPGHSNAVVGISTLLSLTAISLTPSPSVLRRGTRVGCGRCPPFRCWRRRRRGSAFSPLVGQTTAVVSRALRRRLAYAAGGRWFARHAYQALSDEGRENGERRGCDMAWRGAWRDQASYRLLGGGAFEK